MFVLKKVKDDIADISACPCMLHSSILHSTHTLESGQINENKTNDRLWNEMTLMVHKIIFGA